MSSVDRLPGPHVVELGLLEVRRNPDVVGHEHGEVRAGLRKLADGAAVRLTTRPGCAGGDGRVGEVELRLVALGAGLREARLRAVALRLQRVDLALRDIERRLRALQRRLPAAKLRAILLGVLHGAGARPAPDAGSARPAARANISAACACSTCAWLALICACWTRDLRVDVVDAGLRGRDLRLRLVERDAVVAVVDAGDHARPAVTCWLSVTGTLVT